MKKINRKGRMEGERRISKGKWEKWKKLKEGIHSLLIPLHILRENRLIICFSVSQAQISFMWATPTCQSTFCQSERMWKPSIFIFMVSLSALVSLKLAFRNSKCHGCFGSCLRIYSSRYTEKVKDLFISAEF